ncbi:MAG: type II toxin-antitoxin system VapC family toxin, partial [Ktedonobacterales bacterium]
LRQEPKPLRRLTTADSVHVPSIVLGELYYGAYKSALVAQNVAKADLVARDNTILACDAATARVYGAIKADLRAKGQPIPDNDMWIAALAMQHQLTLLTRDAHFERIESLALERW